MTPRLARAAALVIVLGVALSNSATFRAALPGQSRAFLIVKSDLGIHYGKFEEDCPQGFEIKTLAMLADGYPDPETGQCTMISSATNLKGIPVFIAANRGELSSRK